MMAGIVGNKSAAIGLSNSGGSKNGNEERTMNCEICKVIQKLGLPKSTHELWLCTSKGVPRRRSRVAMVEQRTRRLQHLFA
jgi:hypothetical protein